METSKALVELETSLVSCFPAFRVKLKNWHFFTPKSVDFQICLWTWTWITSPFFLEFLICLLQILGLLSLHYYMSPPHTTPPPPYKYIHQFSSVQFSSVTQSCLTLCNPWTAAWQASLSITNSKSLLRFIPVESVMAANSLILCRPLLLLPSIFPSIRVFSKESVLHIRRQSIGASASASLLPMNIQDWFPLGWTGCISLQSKGLSRVFSNTTVQKHQFFSTQHSLWFNSHIHTWLLEKL